MELDIIYCTSIDNIIDLYNEMIENENNPENENDNRKIITFDDTYTDLLDEMFEEVGWHVYNSEYGTQSNLLVGPYYQNELYGSLVIDEYIFEISKQSLLINDKYKKIKGYNGEYFFDTEQGFMDFTTGSTINYETFDFSDVLPLQITFYKRKFTAST